MSLRALFGACLLLILVSCLTYYERNLVFHQNFAAGNYAEADASLDHNKFIQKKRNQLLYYLDKGVTKQLMGEYAESNEFFELAYLYIEDFRQNYGIEALALVTNDMLRNYGGEDFEQIFLHYYKAINYMFMDQIDEALVEVRRINIKLNEINDKYKSEAKYKRDAFAHTLMGLLYEASGDENNAFIAYRNAYEIYSTDYKEFFAMSPPNQLKRDLLRTAYLNGFYEEVEFYEKEFKMKYEHVHQAPKDLVFIWHNGLGPIKDEWSINFAVVRGAGGYVSFVNKELGLTFGFYTRSTDEYNSLGNLKVVRVAFPRYTSRQGTYSGGMLKLNGQEYRMERLEDFDAIAIKSLEDRMIRELSKTLLRQALKQAAEYAARQENEGLGAAVSILNAATEKADTRNWQTLPSKVYYARVPITQDSAKIEFYTQRGDHGKLQETLEANTSKKLQFRFRQTVPKESILQDKF